MSKLYFNYSTMNAGKSTQLLQTAHNYRERGIKVYLITAEVDNRSGGGVISSRIGIKMDADTFNSDSNLYEMIEKKVEDESIQVVLIDEVQFLKKEQVWQLACIVDDLKIKVFCYGLRLDFQGNMFEGSTSLMSWADTIKEVITTCHCGKKATMVIRKDDNGKAVKNGDQVQIGGNDTYVSLCRNHWRQCYGNLDNT